MPRSRVLPVVSVGLAVAFLGAGAAKVLRLDFEVEAFARYGIPTWLMVQVGIVEILAALLLLRPKTATLGAILGVAVMSVAIPTHLFSGEAPMTPLPLAFLAAFVFVGWSRRAHLAALLRR